MFYFLCALNMDLIDFQNSALIHHGGEFSVATRGQPKLLETNCSVKLSWHVETKLSIVSVVECANQILVLCHCSDIIYG